MEKEGLPQDRLPLDEQPSFLEELWLLLDCVESASMWQELLPVVSSLFTLLRWYRLQRPWLAWIEEILPERAFRLQPGQGHIHELCRVLDQHTVSPSRCP